MRRLSDGSVREMQYALDDLDRRLRVVEQDTGELDIPTGEARRPLRGARIYYDEGTGKLVVVTRDGASYWSKD